MIRNKFSVVWNRGGASLLIAVCMILSVVGYGNGNVRAEPLLTLSPDSAANALGDPHTLTAVLIDGDTGAPMPDRKVLFRVLAGPSRSTYTDGVIDVVETDGNGVARTTYASDLPGRDVIRAEFAGDYFSNIVTKDWGPGETLRITPEVATNGVGTEHSFTATIADSRIKDPTGIEISCWVESGPNAGWKAAATASDAGTAVFSYVSNGTVGVDAILCSYTAGRIVFLSNTALKQWIPGNRITLSPLTGTRRLGETHTVTAEVVGEAGGPLEGVQVEFRILSGPNDYQTAFPYRTVTDAQGRAFFTYSGTGGEGTDRIVASFVDAAGKEYVSNEVQNTWYLYGGITVTPSSATNPVGSAHVLEALVIDEAGKPVADQPVTFQVISGPNAGVSATVETDGEGKARFEYVGSGGEGTDQIRAAAVDASGREMASVVTKNWVYSEQITLSPATSRGKVGGAHSVVALLQDFERKPLSGWPVTFEIVSGPNQGLSQTVTTDGSGLAWFTYTGTGGPGRDAVRASFLNSRKEIQVSETVTRDWLDGDTLFLTQDTDRNPVGSEHTVVAELVHDDGSPIPEWPVTFRVMDGPNAGKSLETRTDGSGMATFLYLGDGGVGTDLIVASFVDGRGEEKTSEPLRKEWFQGESLQVEPSESVNTIGTPHVLTVYLQDAEGNPVWAREIQFSVVSGPNQGLTGQAITATDGSAVYSYVGAEPGTDVIQVSCITDQNAVLSVSATKRWVRPEVIWIAQASDAEQVGTNHTVTAAVVRDDGTPVEGRSVTFQVTAGPNQGIHFQTTTDAEGRASFTYTGSGGTGTDVIQARFVDSVGRELVSDPLQCAWVAAPITFTLDLPGAAALVPPIHAYRMISLPVVPQETSDLFEVLSPFFGGAADPFVWRVFRPSGSFPDLASVRYEEITAPGQEAVAYGKGYWIISMDPATIAVTGIPFTGDEYVMDIGRGYTMVGCPFAEGSVAWADVLADPANASLGLGGSLYFWDGSGEYVLASHMEPGKAYWVWAENPGTLHIKRRAVAPASFDARHRTVEAQQPPPPPAPGAYLRILCPNGGEQWAPGQKIRIRWESSGIRPGNRAGTIQLWYSEDGGKTFTLIDAVAPDTGEYLWELPEVPSAHYLVGVVSSDYPSVYDVSDGVFSVGW